MVDCYVLADEQGNVTDLGSFYHLPSTIIGHPKHNVLNVTYSYYNVASSVPFVDLMSDMLVLARNTGCDVYNCLDLMQVFFFMTDTGFLLSHLKFIHRIMNYSNR